MKSGIMYEQGDIIIVPFPFSDLSAIKQRPVLVLSSKDYNSKTEDIVTCGITSNLKDEGYSVFIDNKNLENGEIPTPSRVKADKLFTLSKSIIKKKIAKLDLETFKKVKTELFKLI